MVCSGLPASSLVTPIVPNSGGDLWWFAVMCGGLWWFAVVCLLVIPLFDQLQATNSTVRLTALTSDLSATSDDV